MTSSYNICDSTKYDKMQLQHKQTNKQTNKKNKKNKKTNKQTNKQTHKQTNKHKHTSTHMFLRLHIMGLPEIWEPLNPLVHDTQTHWLTLETGC